MESGSIIWLGEIYAFLVLIEAKRQKIANIRNLIAYYHRFEGQ
jgi:hypothetical protein